MRLIDRNLGFDHIAGFATGDSKARLGTNYNLLRDLDFSGRTERPVPAS